MRKHAVGVLSLLALAAPAVALGGCAEDEASDNGETKSPALVKTKAAAHHAPKPKPPARPQTFTGAGDQNLGTINVSTPSTLHWSCPSCTLFSLSGETAGYEHTISVDASNGHTGGVTAVDPGTYHDVEVLDMEEGSSGWMISITPGQ